MWLLSDETERLAIISVVFLVTASLYLTFPLQIRFKRVVRHSNSKSYFWSVTIETAMIFSKANKLIRIRSSSVLGALTLCKRAMRTKAYSFLDKVLTNPDFPFAPMRASKAL